MCGLMACVVFATYCVAAGWISKVKPYWMYLLISALAIIYLFMVFRSWSS